MSVSIPQKIQSDESVSGIPSGSSSANTDVLVVEDRQSLRIMLRRTLESKHYRVAEAADTREAVRLLTSSRVSVVLTDLRLPTGSGMDVLRAAREADPHLPVIVMTAFGTIEDAVAAMKDGAFDFLSKPVDTDHLLVLTERAVEQRRLRMENLLLKEAYAARYGFPQIIGEDRALEEVSRAIQRAAVADTTVLLTGESGTGKELFARALHHLSPRRDGPFLAINCAAIPDSLLENELFGHEKGAFTGATGRKLGKLELADRGTVLLDEIGEIPLGLQSKLLRVLQEHSFERVGGTSTINVDVRIVAATNRDLAQAIEDKLFRDDLFYRLSVFPIMIPPLRSRRGDIPLLARHYVERFCRELGKPLVTITEKSMERLVSHNWPGNVRELANCIERAVLLSDETDLAPEVLGFVASREIASPPIGFDMAGSLAQVSRRAVASAEKEKVRMVMEEVDGDRTRAAERLQVSSKTLLSKLREYGFVGKTLNKEHGVLAMRKTMTEFRDEDSRGFTLIEVLISMAITIIVMGAVFGLLTRGQRSFQREPQVAELQQNARTALDMVSKDVLQAGAGLPVEFPSFTTTAINANVGDGGTGPDVLEIVGSSSSAGEMYYAPEPVVNFDGTTNVTLGLAATGLEVGNLVVVYDNNELNPNWVMAFVTTVVNGSAPDESTVTLDATYGTAVVPGGYSNNPDGFTTGFITRVSVVQYSTQMQGNDLILRRQVDFGQTNPVGMLDDFQVAYLVGTQPQVEQVNPPPPQPTRGIQILPVDIISGIRITVAARSTQENLAGSSQGASGDYIRKTFSSNISPRNVIAGCAERLGTQCSI